MSEAASMKAIHSEKEEYKRDQVVQIINSVIDKLQKNDHEARDALYGELEQLRAIIEQARLEISSARPADIKDKHIPSATDELDAVVGATEEATGIIMDSCEAIQALAAELSPAFKDGVDAAITKIFEACSFQDITGQRITKVVKTLKLIDEKITSLLHVVGSKVPGFEQENREEHQNEISLLNGPQLPDKAIRQDDIDKLLAAFDN